MSGGRHRVLLIDDEPFIVEAVSRVLDQAGFDTFSCVTWAEVNGVIRDVEPDIILLDYNMPMIKGDSMCSILKRNTLNPEMRIVLFSSEEEGFLRDVARECGADGYISKSTPSRDLAGRVNDFVSGSPL